MKSRRRALAGLLLAVSGTAAAASIQVEFKSDASRKSMDCFYTVTNGSQKPVVGFILGAGVQAAGPYEFATTPVGSQSPRAWEFSAFSPDPNQRIAVEWQARDFSHALMPGATLTQLMVRFDAGAECSGVHWTAINRDSEMESGEI